MMNNRMEVMYTTEKMKDFDNLLTLILQTYNQRNGNITSVTLSYSDKYTRKVSIIINSYSVDILENDPEDIRKWFKRITNIVFSNVSQANRYNDINIIHRRVD